MNAAPLCVDLKTAAKSIGVSTWTLRAWIDAGLIKTTRFPSSRHAGETSRRKLIAMEDLKVFVDRHREGVA